MAKRQKTIAETALEDSKMICQLTKAAKEDSSTMKTIAVLTMMFLPGAAFSSILDTPFLVWDSKQHGLVVRGGHLFWIITIPLTVGVIIMWWLVVRLSWGEVSKKIWAYLRSNKSGEWSDDTVAEMQRPSNMAGHMVSYDGIFVLGFLNLWFVPKGLAPEATG